MLHRADGPLQEKAATLVLVVAIHAALLTLLISRSQARPALTAKPAGLALVSIVTEPDAGKPPPPALPSRIAVERQKLVPPSTASQVESLARGSSTGCATLELAGKAIMADPAAVNAVVHAPPESRSIAEAVVIWNAGWSETARDLSAPLGPTRAALEQSLKALPADCLAEVVAGPRLVPVPIGEGRTMFVVIGSGTWMWGQLLIATPPIDFVSQPPPSRSPPSSRSWDWFSTGGAI